MPDAKPVMAKLGESVVLVEPLLRLGGEPVARSDDSRFPPLLVLVIELDIGVHSIFCGFKFSMRQIAVPFLRQKLGRRVGAVRGYN
jgi:hypothetical protein